jgi:hypothetical protein
MKNTIKYILILSLLTSINCIAAEPVLVAYMSGLGERPVVANGQPISTGVVLLGTFTGEPNMQLKGFTVLHGTALRTICGEPGRYAGMKELTPTGKKLFVFISSPQGGGLFSSTHWILPSEEGVFATMFLVASDINQAWHGAVADDALMLSK